MNDRFSGSDVEEVLPSSCPPKEKTPLTDEQKQRLENLRTVDSVQYLDCKALVTTMPFDSSLDVITVTLPLSDGRFFDVMYNPVSATIHVKRGGEEAFFKFLMEYRTVS